MAIAVRTLSSLEKVFPDEELTAEETASLAALRGERVSFQIACRALDEERVVLRAHAQCALSVPVELYEVGLVPVTLPLLPEPRRQLSAHNARSLSGSSVSPPGRDAGGGRPVALPVGVPHRTGRRARRRRACPGAAVPCRYPSPASRRRSWQRSCSACMCCPPACPRRS